MRPGPHLARGDAPGSAPPFPLDPYLDYLRQRWDEGEHSAKVLHPELLGKGYLGHYQRVKMAIAPLRRGLPVDEPRERPPSPRQVARWITTAPDRRGLKSTQRLHRLLEHCPELHRTYELVRQFASVIDARGAAPLPDRLDQLTTAGLPALAGLPPLWARTCPPSSRGSPPPTTSGSTKAAPQT